MENEIEEFAENDAVDAAQMEVHLALAEDLVGGLDVVLEGGLRVVSEKQRLMRPRHFVPFVPDRLEVIGQKTDRILGSILDHLRPGRSWRRKSRKRSLNFFF